MTIIIGNRTSFGTIRSVLVVRITGSILPIRYRIVCNHNVGGQWDDAAKKLGEELPRCEVVVEEVICVVCACDVSGLRPSDIEGEHCHRPGVVAWLVFYRRVAS